MNNYLNRKLKVSKSPWGEDDQIGRLNWITPESRADIFNLIDTTKLYDLTVDYFMGMPSWKGAADQGFQIWMTHTPRGNYIDNLSKTTDEGNALVGYSGDSISMYTHTGTHIDALNHFGYMGEIWNGYNQDEHLGSRHWTKCGIERFPFIVARAVLIDVAGYKGLDMLPDSYPITPEDIEATLRMENISLKKGDFVMIRTGRMKIWPDVKWEVNTPGITLESAEYLASNGAMVIAADNISLEMAPSLEKDNWQPVHCYLFAEAGIPIAELLWLEELAKNKIYEGGVLASVMPIRGATGAPFQPMFFPFKN